MTMINEQQYLKLYPDRHKINFYINLEGEGYFYKIISVNGEKINMPDLTKCIKFKNSDIKCDNKTIKTTNNDELWELSLLKNVDYIKDNAIVSVFGNHCVVLGYISESGMWKGYTPKSDVIAATMTPHKIDSGLIDALPQIFEQNSSVVDFGCGNADYVKHLHNNGFNVEAYDGNPNTPEMTDGLGKVLDLSKDFDLGKKFDYVISLEVAEHIPKKFENVYVNNLIKHTGYYLIVSWALIGQGGDGHVNEQNEDYVLDLFDKLGMNYHQDISKILRDVAKLGWFKKTIYVFSKKNN